MRRCSPVSCVPSGPTPTDIAVSEPVAERRAELEQRRFPACVVRDAPVAADGAIVAVKPAYVTEAAAALAAAGCGRVLSIAAGVPTATIEAALPGRNAGRACDAKHASARGRRCVGDCAGRRRQPTTTLRGPSRFSPRSASSCACPEAQLDAVTGLSGSGPAYVFLVAEAMIEAGESVGLPSDVATRLAIQTILGAGRMLAESGDSPEDLRAAVSSPNGTTVAGLAVLDELGVRDAFEAAVAARH